MPTSKNYTFYSWSCIVDKGQEPFHTNSVGMRDVSAKVAEQLALRATPGSDTLSHESLQRCGQPRSLPHSEGSRLEAAIRPPMKAPGTPGLVTSWPASRRPGTGVRTCRSGLLRRSAVISIP